MAQTGPPPDAQPDPEPTPESPDTPDTPDTPAGQPEPPHVIAQRNSLPDTRESVTHKFQIMNHEGYLTIGLHGDGRVGEVFIKMAKEGSTLSGLLQGYCRALSLALQYGLPLDEACRRFKGMRFEPMGPTGNPDIPEAMSIIDYVARYLELTFHDQPTADRPNLRLSE
jgi:ribonucleoside-diphosphate reductase alpha chain